MGTTEREFDPPITKAEAINILLKEVEDSLVLVEAAHVVFDDSGTTIEVTGYANENQINTVKEPSERGWFKKTWKKIKKGGKKLWNKHKKKIKVQKLKLKWGVKEGVKWIVAGK